MDGQERGMPVNVSELFEPVWQDTVLLQAKLGIFKNLYSKEESVRLLNTTAPGFFYIMQLNLLHDLYLGITRLTDPPESMRKPNLSLRQVVARIDPTVHGVLVASLQNKLDVLDARCDFARSRRNRTIAHSDLDTRLDRHPAPLAPVDMKMIDTAVAGICEVVNDIELAFRNVTTLFGPDTFADAEDLLLALRDVATMRANEEARLRGLIGVEPNDTRHEA